MNILEKISKIRAKSCFIFNKSLFFVVRKEDVLKAIGPNGRNARKISLILKKRIRILAEPKNNKEKINFIKELISPIKVEEIKINENEVIINAGVQERSMLIGRNRKVEKEMLDIMNLLFGIKKISFQK